MDYGYFDDQQREYVITRPDTPLPWINYLGSEEFFGLISNTGGGYCFFRDARLRRLTRYRYNNAPLDGSGRNIYLRDDENGEFWSPTWQPTRKKLDEYTCRHGLGYTSIQSGYQGIQAKLRYFVPLGDTLEVWQVWITNQREEAVSLSLFSAVEFCLWDAWDDATNFQRNLSTGEVEIEDEVIYHKTEYRERRNHFAYFACSEPLAGYETQRDAFLGAYRGWDDPQTVAEGKCANSHAYGWQPVGAQHVRFELAPGETRQMIFVLGYSENLPQDKFDPPNSMTLNKKIVKPLIARYTQPAQAEAAYQKLRDHWDRLLATLQVKTPCEHTNRMVNIWNTYQCMVTFNISRSASYFESGIGRGMGFRDSNQDLMGFVQMVPQRARQRLLDLAATQLESGGAYHQYQPLTKRGNNDVGTNFNDDPLWLVLAAAAYVKETGDGEILDVPVTYDNRPGSEQPLYEHLQRSIRYTMDRLGTHGLPLIGRADWNDCLNLNCFSEKPGQSFQTTTNKDGRVAESVFIGGLFVLAAGEMASLAQYRGLVEEAHQYTAWQEQMATVVLQHGWDGSWFRRAYDDAGYPVGSEECEEGKIFIEPQGICVMAGLGLGDGKAEKALDAVREHLATPHGIVLQQPAYSRYYLNLGEISSYPPGYKENAGIFCHANPWVMIAETKLGRGDQAHDYYLRINPSARQRLSELHRCEPYVYAQMIAGRDAPNHGEAKNSWLTGTAAWNYIAITQWMLGIRPTLEGLVVAPVIPETWKGFACVRIFRGVTYSITVERRGSGNRARLSVAGKPLTGTLVPLPPAGTEQVEVLVELE
jgi:cellobiose phosphorylase